MLGELVLKSCVPPPKALGLKAWKPVEADAAFPNMPVPDMPFVEDAGPEKADLEDAPTPGGGRAGREGCGCGVDEAEEFEVFKPGGGGYDMMNSCNSHAVWARNIPVGP